MIIVKFHGGLGNQMFQYVFYKQLQLIYPDVEIKADLSRYDFEKFREHNGFELEKIFRDIDLDKANTMEILKAGGFCERKKSSFVDILTKRITATISRLQSIGSISLKRRLDEQDWIKLKAKYPNHIQKKSYFLYGYWSEQNSMGHQLFQFKEICDSKNLDLMKTIENVEAVSIHVRKGDYVGTTFDVLTSDYYQKAIMHIEKLVENPSYFIFSDDSNYVKKEFAMMNHKTIVDWNKKNDSYKDMLLMSKCKHNIICNSTFSYWAAELNENMEKVIIVPQFYLKETQRCSNGRWIGV